MSWDFKGSGRPPTAAGYIKAADFLGAPEAYFRAVVQVEAASKFFNRDGTPLLAFEPHVFYRSLPKPLKEDAVDKGLAHPKWGKLPYLRSQKARYRQLAAARKIHDGAGLKACSYGGPQILGENFELCGFRSVQKFCAAMATDGDTQLMAMASFIHNSKKRVRSKVTGDRMNAHQALQAGDFYVFAEIYNGPAQEKNDYEGKLARWALKFSSKRIAKKIEKEVKDPGGAKKEKTFWTIEMPTGLGVAAGVTAPIHQLKEGVVYLKGFATEMWFASTGAAVLGMIVTCLMVWKGILLVRKWKNKEAPV